MLIETFYFLQQDYFLKHLLLIIFGLRAMNPIVIIVQAVLDLDRLLYNVVNLGHLQEHEDCQDYLEVVNLQAESYNQDENDLQNK